MIHHIFHTSHLHVATFSMKKAIGMPSQNKWKHSSIYNPKSEIRNRIAVCRLPSVVPFLCQDAYIASFLVRRNRLIITRNED